MSVAVELKNISKSFPGVQALDDVSLEIEKGEVHAIVGENGAGKSSLMKVLGGVYIPDDGDIFINGKKSHIRSVRDSISEGISVIFQEFNLMPELTVAENIFISQLPMVKFFNLVKFKELKQKTRELMDRLEIDLDPMEFVSSLSISKKQMVEIAKALSHQSEIIIMDEPTASLNEKEVDKIYKIIRKLKAENKTIIYISHRLEEVFEVADKVTVLRDGKYIGTRDIKEIDENTIVHMMVGRDIESFYHQSEAHIGEVMFSVKSLTKKNVFEDISFSVKKGEILGLSGLMGCGRVDILKAIYGLTDYESGDVFMENKKVTIKDPKDAISSGIDFLTNDRKESGILAQMSVRENITLNIIRKLCKFFNIFTDVDKEQQLLEKYTQFMNLKYSDEHQQIMFLSGGNQQKIILGRALAGNCKVLLLLEPTRGIDVLAKSEIYTLLSDLAQAGMAIVMISSELPELISISNRILVVWQGKITGELMGKDINEHNVMQCATGNKNIFSEAG